MKYKVYSRLESKLRFFQAVFISVTRRDGTHSKKRLMSYVLNKAAVESHSVTQASTSTNLLNSIHL